MNFSMPHFEWITFLAALLDWGTRLLPYFLAVVVVLFVAAFFVERHNHKKESARKSAACAEHYVTNAKRKRA